MLELLSVDVCNDGYRASLQQSLVKVVSLDHKEYAVKECERQCELEARNRAFGSYGGDFEFGL